MLFPESREFAPPWRWGIFCRKPCAGLSLSSNSPDYEPMTAIYRVLKNAGFEETYWQFVYPGQVGGLVKIPRGTLIEFHVRFFEGGMIYAEMELGRSVLLHFLNRRYYINHHLVKKLNSKLSSSQIAYLRTSTERYKASCACDWPEWTMENRFMTPGIKRQVRFFTVLSDWRLLALIMLAGIISSIADGPVALALLTAAMILVYLLAPKRSH
jgi:hypothetical protein